jgi:hypothetical protein
MKKLLSISLLAIMSTLSVYAQGNSGTGNTATGGTIKIIVGSKELTATLVQNSSTAALREMLRAGPITIHMRDYGNFEKIGEFDRTLPTNDVRFTTEPGDLILYQGKSFVIYYAPNTWSLTRLGKINNVTQVELKNILGAGNVTVILELAE